MRKEATRKRDGTETSKSRKQGKMSSPKTNKETTPIVMPAVEVVQRELGRPKSLDDFSGKREFLPDYLQRPWNNCWKQK
jgi:hypothetical protein